MPQPNGWWERSRRSTNCMWHWHPDIIGQMTMACGSNIGGLHTDSRSEMPEECSYTRICKRCLSIYNKEVTLRSR